MGILKSSSRLSFQTPVGKSRRFVSTGRWCPFSRVPLTRQLHRSPSRVPGGGRGPNAHTAPLCFKEGEENQEGCGDDGRKEEMRARKGNIGVEGGRGQPGGPPPFP